MSETNLPPSTSRRDFLKTSAAIAGAAVTASALVGRTAYAAGSDQVKVALVGCGGRGSGALGQALHTSNSVSLVAVADAFEDNAQRGLSQYKKNFGGQVSIKDDKVFHGFDAYKQAIDSNADLVILATPPGFRPIHFEAAVAAGKNVFTEKPVATDSQGVRRFLAASAEADKKNLKVGVGLQRHHDPKYQEIVKRLHDGDIGDIILLRVYWNGTRPWVRPRKDGQTEMEFQMRNWYYFTWTCGDHINEQHIHNLDVANWVMKGPPEMAQGTGGRQLPFGPNQGEIFDHHMIEYTYPNGTKMLSMCRHQPGVWNAVSEFAHGTKGVADLSGGRIKYTDGRPEWRYQKQAEGKQDPYQIEHDDLFAAIRDNKPYNEAPYGASSTMTAILGRMATYSGQEIKYADALARGVDYMPKEFDWKAEPPVKPGPDGLYPCALPGKTQVLIPVPKKA
jgi:myo-inositol 2-dehydrogenase/D-chiro-inositol 1-dehydrogenase